MIRQRGRSFEVRVFAGVDAVTGKKRYVSETVRGTKRDAERRLSALVAEVDSGRVARTKATVGELLEAWFEHARADFSPKTALETRGVLDRELIPGLGSVALAKLRVEDVDRFYRQLRAPGGGRRRKGLAPATVKRIHGVLRRALTQGVRWGWIAVNPAVAASPPRVDVPELRPPTPGELARLLAVATAEDSEFATFLVVAAASGARRSEVLALRWTDVDFVKRRLTIARGVVLGIDGLVEKDTKTHQARRVSLDQRTIEVLREHRARADVRAAACGVVIARDALVFSADGLGQTPRLPDSTTRSFRRLCEKAGVEGVRLHDLRHYVATRLLGAGVDVRTVAGRLGHRDTSTTLNVYAHFLPEADEHAADVLARLLDAAS